MHNWHFHCLLSYCCVALRKLWLCLLSTLTLGSFKQQLCLWASLWFLFLMMSSLHFPSLSWHTVCSSAQPPWQSFTWLDPVYQCFVLGSPNLDTMLQVGSHKCLLVTLLFAQPRSLSAGFAARAMRAYSQLAVYLPQFPWPIGDDTVGPCCNITQFPQMELVWSYRTCPIGLSNPELVFHLL